MNHYQLLFHPKIGKQVQALGDLDRKKVRKALQSLAHDGFSYPHPHVKKLQGVDNVYRLKVGVIRVILEVDVRQQRIYVRKLGHRRDIYRDY